VSTPQQVNNTTPWQLTETLVPIIAWSMKTEHEKMGAISVIYYSRLYFPKFDDNNQVEWRWQ
jgi:hypothetical protein